MFLLFLTLFSAAVVAVDQITKFLVVENIPLYADIPLLPGVVQLTYAQNTGAAFSMLQGQQWLFALIFAVFTAAILWAYFKKTFPFSKFEWFCIAAVYAGGLGNMIDRLRLGYVIDMIETLFIQFPVFNVADSFITCGCIALMVSLIFFNKAFWKDGKK
ncbi:MAG: signal peptidase II [Oscillospiraceae bacterium]|nr:signal peptidase II [Oscillospiraceae bacterium]